MASGLAISRPNIRPVRQHLKAAQELLFTDSSTSPHRVFFQSGTNSPVQVNVNLDGTSNAFGLLDLQRSEANQGLIIGTESNPRLTKDTYYFRECFMTLSLAVSALE